MSAASFVRNNFIDPVFHRVIQRVYVTLCIAFVANNEI